MSDSYNAEQEKIILEVLSKQKHAFYEILNVEKTADSNEIKKAYRKLAIKLHPDKNSHPKASEAFKVINRAFEVLGDDNKRQMFDRIGRDPDDRSVPQFDDSNRGSTSSFARQAGGVPPEFFATRGFGGMGSPFMQAGGPEDIFDFLFNMNAGGPGATTFTFGPNGFRAYGGGNPRAAFARRQQQQRQARRQHDEDSRWQDIIRVLLPLLLFFFLPVLERLFFG